MINSEYEEQYYQEMWCENLHKHTIGGYTRLMSNKKGDLPVKREFSGVFSGVWEYVCVCVCELGVGGHLQSSLCPWVHSNHLHTHDGSSHSHRDQSSGRHTALRTLS